MIVLAWRPFLDPINAHEVWWLFLVPLALGISIAYKAVRMRRLDRYWPQVVGMTFQIIVAMIVLGLVGYLFVLFIVPRLG